MTHRLNSLLLIRTSLFRYNGTLYGAFYDLEKGYIEPPKVEEKVFTIKTIKNNVQESVVNFISRA